jgi:hypothetical protein
MKVNLEQDEIIAKHAYLIADKQAQTINSYCKLYIKTKPWWLPEVLYKWVIGKVLVLAHFKKPTRTIVNL